MTVDDNGLSALFQPRSIAVVGASTDPRKIGGSPLDYLTRYGFAGTIHAVNAVHAEVQGRTAHRSLAAIGEPVDLAIIAVPARSVAATMDDAARAGVRAAVLFSSGFAEMGEAGAGAQQQVAAIASAAGIRLLGPNCMGLMSLRERAFSTFTPAIAASPPPSGNIAIVSQSGAFGAYAMQLARARGLGLSYWVTTGNEADVELGDCVYWLAGDPHTQVILCYLEGCRDGPRLRRAFERAALAGKRVVVTKVGRTALGQAAAASHTAALAGEDTVYDALFRQYGVHRASTIDEFFTVGYAAARSALPAGRRIALLTASGGVGALMADEAATLGLDAVELPADRQQPLRERVPFAATRNPIDFTGQFTSEPDLMELAIESAAGSGCYDMLPVFMAAAGASPKLAPLIVSTMLAVRQRHPAIPLALITLLADADRQRLEEAGCLVFEEPSYAVRALAALAALGEARQRVARRLAATAGAGAAAGPTEDAEVPAPAAPPATGPLSELSALRLLAAAGVPMVDARLARDAGEAVAHARAIGLPVVLKIVSPQIAHKTEVGGVRLNLRDEAAVAEAFEAVTTAARLARPDAVIEGVIVAPMVDDGIEVIAGIHHDPVFGPVVMLGLGGILAETLRDVAVRLAPIDRTDAREMLDGLRARALFDGVRGAPAADIDALLDALVALAGFAQRHADSIADVEINPLRVLARGRGVLALDALIVPHATAGNDDRD